MDAAAALCRTYLAYLRLGATTVEGPSCHVVRQDDAPTCWDANHLQVGEGADADRVLAFQDEQLGDRAHHQVITTPFTPPGLDARLVIEGYAPDDGVHGLLVGELRGAEPIDCDIRPVSSEADWSHLDRLVRLDHEEESAQEGNVVISAETTREIQHVRRLRADVVHFFMAWDDGRPVAFFSSWPGVGGLGMVEDLYTLPSHRGRGFARALIHHCVADARARGASSVQIGADPEDTPKDLYARMGFEPTCVLRAWQRDREPSVERTPDQR